MLKDVDCPTRISLFASRISGERVGDVGICRPYRASCGAPHCQVDYRYLIPTSMVFGGILIVYADTLARMMIAPGEIPVGVLMSFGCSILLVSIERGGAKMSVLIVDNITVGYGKRLILENQSIVFDKPEIISIIGPNGSGKSTF